MERSRTRNDANRKWPLSTHFASFPWSATPLRSGSKREGRVFKSRSPLLQEDPGTAWVFSAYVRLWRTSCGTPYHIGTAAAPNPGPADPFATGGRWLGNRPFRQTFVNPVEAPFGLRH